MGRDFRPPSTLPCGTAADLIILISSEILYLYMCSVSAVRHIFTATDHLVPHARLTRSRLTVDQCPYPGMAVSLCSTANATAGAPMGAPPAVKEDLFTVKVPLPGCSCC